MRVRGSRQAVIEEYEIRGAAEDRIAIISPLNDVQRQIRHEEARQTGHVPQNSAWARNAISSKGGNRVGLQLKRGNWSLTLGIGV